MSTRMRIIFAVLAIGFASLGVFGDPMFRAMGFPPNSGRAVVAVGLLVVGIVFFAWTSIRFHLQDKKEAAARRDKTGANKVGANKTDANKTGRDNTIGS